jgi:hypothetical protein
LSRKIVVEAAGLYSIISGGDMDKATTRGTSGGKSRGMSGGKSRRMRGGKSRGMSGGKSR